jgi:hypothetical protein
MSNDEDIDEEEELEFRDKLISRTMMMTSWIK